MELERTQERGIDDTDIGEHLSVQTNHYFHLENLQTFNTYNFELFSIRPATISELVSQDKSHS
jgi:hypothetical protein